MALPKTRRSESADFAQALPFIAPSAPSSFFACKGNIIPINFMRDQAEMSVPVMPQQYNKARGTGDGGGTAHEGMADLIDNSRI